MSLAKSIRHFIRSRIRYYSLTYCDQDKRKKVQAKSQAKASTIKKCGKNNKD